LILFSGTLSIKQDKENIQQYKIQVVACDDGPPPIGDALCSDPVNITVDVVNNEPPKWDPTTLGPVSIDEDVNAANTTVITATAIDQDTKDLFFRMHCNPATDIFDYEPKASTQPSRYTLIKPHECGF
jgi:hypothetical protein